MKDVQRIIKRVQVTEKGTSLLSRNKYLFEVHPDANKIDIRRAVEKIYGVKVTSVATQIMRGKMKRVGRNIGRRPNRKKAIVTLAEGSSIDFFAPA